MTNSLETTGFIISVTTYKENDAIINLLTTSGVITFVARGIMKIDSRFGTLCQLYNKVEVSLDQSRRSGYYNLVGGKVLTNFQPIYENLEAMVTTSLLVEIIRKTIDEYNVENLYNLLSCAYEAILNKIDLSIIRVVFISQIIIATGLKLDVNECVRCHSTKGILSLSFDDGGFVCQKCFNPSVDVQCKPLYIKLVRYLFIADYHEAINKNLPLFESQKLFDDLYDFLCKQLSISLKSYKLLKKIRE